MTLKIPSYKELITEETVIGGRKIFSMSRVWRTFLDALTRLLNTLESTLETKADKVTGATAGNFAGLDADGNLTDSGHKDADYADATHAHGALTGGLLVQANTHESPDTDVATTSLHHTLGTGATQAAAGTAPAAAIVSHKAEATPHTQYVEGDLAVTSAQFDKTDATLSNVTGLSLSLSVGTYTFEATVFIDAAAAGGFKIGVGGTVIATSVLFQITAIDNDAVSLVVSEAKTAIGESSEYI